MKTVHTSFLVVSAFTLLLAACGQSVGDKMAENAIEKQTGGQASVDTNNGTMHVTTSEGTFDVGAHALPADWPTDVPAYAGATVQYSASVNPATDAPGSMVVLMSTDDAQTIADYYANTLKANGWTIGSTMQAQGTTIMTAIKDDRAVSLSVASANNETTITIGVGKKS